PMVNAPAPSWTTRTSGSPHRTTGPTSKRPSMTGVADPPTATATTQATRLTVRAISAGPRRPRTDGPGAVSRARDAVTGPGERAGIVAAAAPPPRPPGGSQRSRRRLRADRSGRDRPRPNPLGARLRQGH